MTDLENREAFLLELKERGYLFENTSWMTELGGHSGIFEDDQLQMVWEMWNASAQREGYKLAPLKPSEETKQKMLIVFNESDGFLNCENIYKAMINAV